MLKPGRDYIGTGVGIILLDDQNRLFVGKRGLKARNEVSLWECPGGTVDFLERLEDAAVREAKEEYDIDIEITRMLGTFNHLLPAEKQHWVSTAFFGRIILGTPRIMEPDKCTEIGWFSLAQLQGMHLSTITRDNILELRRQQPELT